MNDDFSENPLFFVNKDGSVVPNQESVEPPFSSDLPEDKGCTCKYGNDPEDMCSQCDTGYHYRCRYGCTLE